MEQHRSTTCLTTRIALSQLSDVGFDICLLQGLLEAPWVDADGKGRNTSQKTVVLHSLWCALQQSASSSSRMCVLTGVPYKSRHHYAHVFSKMSFQSILLRPWERQGSAFRTMHNNKPCSVVPCSHRTFASQMCYSTDRTRAPSCGIITMEDNLIHDCNCLAASKAHMGQTSRFLPDAKLDWIGVPWQHRNMQPGFLTGWVCPFGHQP